MHLGSACQPVSESHIYKFTKHSLMHTEAYSHIHKHILQVLSIMNNRGRSSRRPETRSRAKQQTKRSLKAVLSEISEVMWGAWSQNQAKANKNTKPKASKPRSTAPTFEEVGSFAKGLMNLLCKM